MADVAGKKGENGDLDMECVDDDLSVDQMHNVPETSLFITVIKNRFLKLIEEIKKPKETVEMSVTNQDGFQELNLTFFKPDRIVKSIPSTAPPTSKPSTVPPKSSTSAAPPPSKPQVVPRIQSVTSLAPKVVQQPLIQQGNITYRMVPLLNQNTSNIPASSHAVQGIDYRYVLPTQPQQTLIAQPVTKQPINQSVIIPTNPLLVQPVNASTPVKVSYQTVAHVNKPQTSTAIGRTSKTAEVSRPTENLRDDNGNLIELIYYGSKQGNVSFGQSRGNFTFKCGQCQKVLTSNILYMKHIKEHFEVLRLKNKSSNLECEHCFKAFPFIKDLQTHKEKVHFNSVFKCKFCEYSFPDKTALMTHLGKKHKPLQMPYVCKLCGYMTSIYQDVLQHFEKRHDRTKFVLCHLCLKVMVDVRNFFKHCQMHYQSSNLSKGHCRSCKLIFLNSQDFRDHAGKEHIIHNLSEKTLAPKPTSKRQLPQIPTQSSSQVPAKKSKTDNTPSTTQSTALSFAKCIPEFQGPLRCCECGARANIQNHFRKHVLQCRRCRYQTYCQRSYSSHSNIFHSNQRSPPVLHPIEKIYNRSKTSVTLRCKRCFFTTQSASFMAWHVVICPKGSSIVESFCYRKNTAVVSQPKKVIVNSDDPIVIDDDSDDEDKSKSNAPTTSKNAVAVNGVH